MACTGLEASSEQGPQGTDTHSLNLPALAVIWWLGRDWETKFAMCRLNTEISDKRFFGGRGRRGCVANTRCGVLLSSKCWPLGLSKRATVNASHSEVQFPSGYPDKRLGWIALFLKVCSSVGIRTKMAVDVLALVSMPRQPCHPRAMARLQHGACGGFCIAMIGMANPTSLLTAGAGLKCFDSHACCSSFPPRLALFLVLEVKVRPWLMLGKSSAIEWYLWLPSKLWIHISRFDFLLSGSKALF